LVEFMVRLGDALAPHRAVPMVRDFLSRADLD
jgi:hypothetical protein